MVGSPKGHKEGREAREWELPVVQAPKQFILPTVQKAAGVQRGHSVPPAPEHPVNICTLGSTGVLTPLNSATQESHCSEARPDPLGRRGSSSPRSVAGRKNLPLPLGQRRLEG